MIVQSVRDPPAPVVLVVEDDPEIAALMRDYLEADDFRVWLAPDAEEAAKFLQRSPDCVLLDVMLPGASGFQLCRDIRTASDTPVLFVSALDGDAEKLRGLGLGADDYIVKSATPAEVVARVKAVLRRSGAGQRSDASASDRVELDLAAHEVLLAGRPVRMTAREFELLRVLVQHPRQVFSREHLFELVWGSYGDRSAVSVYISRLRDKLEDDPADPRYIVTVWAPGTGSTANWRATPRNEPGAPFGSCRGAPSRSSRCYWLPPARRQPATLSKPITSAPTVSTGLPRPRPISSGARQPAGTTSWKTSAVPKARCARAERTADRRLTGRTNAFL